MQNENRLNEQPENEEGSEKKEDEEENVEPE